MIFVGRVLCYQVIVRINVHSLAGSLDNQGIYRDRPGTFIDNAD
jgi:hypothetical protein